MTVPDHTDPEAPGWYGDPGQAHQLRYWDGATWTDRRRPRPVWTDGAAGGPGPGDPDPHPMASPTVAGRSLNRKWLILVAAAVVGATAVLVVGETMRPKTPGPRVLTDSRYVRLADAECARTMPGLYPPDAGPFGKAIPPAETAAQIDRAAGGLDLLADRLRALPASAADRPHVDGWLDGWHRYTGLGRQYAVFLRQHGNASPGSLLVDSNREAKLDDNFALANGLRACTFFVTPQTDPSNGF